MKTSIKVVSICIATVAAFTFTAQGQNLLSDPGFESGTVVPSGMGGWATFNGAHFSTAFADTGSFSMDNAGGGNFSVPGAFQYVAAQPGVSYLLTGFAFVPTTLPGGTSEGFLQMTFVDSTTTVNLGTYSDLYWARRFGFNTGCQQRVAYWHLDSTFPDCHGTRRHRLRRTVYAGPGSKPHDGLF